VKPQRLKLRVQTFFKSCSDNASHFYGFIYKVRLRIDSNHTIRISRCDSRQEVIDKAKEALASARYSLSTYYLRDGALMTKLQDSARIVARYLYAVSHGARVDLKDVKLMSDLLWLSIPMKYRMSKEEIQAIKENIERGVI
jgi:hypothetical protein